MAGIVVSGSNIGHNRVRIDCDGINNAFNVTHNLGSLLLIVQVWDENTSEIVYVDVAVLDENNITVTFGIVPPNTDNYLVHIISRMDSF